MNPKFFIIAAVLGMGLFAVSTFAQNNMDTARKQMYDNIDKQQILYDLVNGCTANLRVVRELSLDYFREGIGVSEEQYRKIRQEMDGANEVIWNDPDYKSLHDEIYKYSPSDPDATEETLKKFAELIIKRDEMIRSSELSPFYNNLIPEQIQKINEFHISNMSETELVFLGMFEALDLSDEQKKQFGEVKKKMEPELNKHIDTFIECQSKWDEKVEEKLKAITDPEKREAFRRASMVHDHDNDILRQLWVELQPDRDKRMESGRKLADKMKIEMFDVLTDAQWNRMIDLVDNPPDYVKKLLAEKRKAREDATAKSSEWQPGPDSWKPGDPIPEQYRQERNERRQLFPRSGE
jgi:Spy/CpxP family protein refolding chaperone